MISPFGFITTRSGRFCPFPPMVTDRSSIRRLSLANQSATRGSASRLLSRARYSSCSSSVIMPRCNARPNAFLRFFGVRTLSITLWSISPTHRVVPRTSMMMSGDVSFHLSTSETTEYGGIIRLSTLSGSALSSLLRAGMSLRSIGLPSS